MSLTYFFLVKPQTTGYKGGVHKVNTLDNVFTYFCRTTTELSSVTPEVQGDGSQQQQGPTSSKTLLQPSEDDCSTGQRAAC